MNDLIQETVQATAKAVVTELKKQGLINEDKRTPFQKTEILLYNYNNFQDAIQDKLLQIEMIKKEGVSKRSKSITFSTGDSGYRENKSELEKAEDKIQEIERSIQVTKNYIEVIDLALEGLSNDPYFEIINMKYFKGQTREDIAEYYDVDVSTVSRNKNRLVNLLQVRLFSDDVIYQIFN